MAIEIKKPTSLTTKLPHVYLKNYLPLLESAVMMLYSNGGVGKTFLSLQVAVRFVMENPRKKVAMWLSEDSEGEISSRFRRICADVGHSDDFFEQRISFITSEPLRFTRLDSGNAELTDDFYDVRQSLIDYSMIVIDPLLQFNGGDENSNTQAGVLMGALKRWAIEETKVILLVHHATFNAQFGSMKGRGAGEWMNGTRGAYSVSRCLIETSKGKYIQDASKRNQLRVVLTKDNGLARYIERNAEGELALELDVFPDAPFKAEPEPEPLTDEVNISVAGHNDAKKPDGFKLYTIGFDHLHEVVLSGFAYSPYTFKDGYRLGDNNQGNMTVLCLDIDDGMTLEQARQKFAKVQALIVTTRSHQKDKGGEICDRFRVLIKLERPLDIPVCEYRDFMAHCFAMVGSVDPSTKDLARFYFSSPADATYFYTDSIKPLDWQPIYEAVRKELALKSIVKQRKTAIKPRGGQEPPNAIPEDTQINTRNGYQSLGSLRASLSVGEKVTCRCLDEIDHGGLGKHHHSAFVQKADNGNVFYSCSGGRCGNVGSLWCAGWE